MSEQTVVSSRNVDSVRIGDITRILKEEGYLEPEPLAPDLTFGQVRGIAGRKYAQVMKRLGDLGFTQSPRTSDLTTAAGGGVQVDCYFVYVLGIPVLVCHIKISIGSSTI